MNKSPKRSKPSLKTQAKKVARTKFKGISASGPDNFAVRVNALLSGEVPVRSRRTLDALEHRDISESVIRDAKEKMGHPQSTIYGVMDPS